MLFSPVAFIVITIWLVAFAITMAIKRSPAALAGGMVFGLLFLPQFMIDLPFMPLTKPVLLALVTAIGVLLVDSNALPVFRPSVIDLPAIVLCGAGCASSVTNGLGIYDGLASATRLFCEWGLPFFIGRVVFASQDNALILLKTMVLGAVLYLPFCAYEMKMSPVLHHFIYGYSPRFGNDFVSAVRFGLWRPTVFMEHGLQLSLFIGISSVVAIWGAVSGRITKVASVPVALVAGVLGVTTILCVSSGAFLLTATGWLVVLSGRLKCDRVLLLALLLVAIGYPVYRMTNVGAIQITYSEADGGEISGRKASLEFRIVNEDRFIKSWKTRPFLGWTRSYFMRVTEEGVTPDSQWIIMLSCHGLVGWLGWSTMQSIPVLAATVRARTANGLQHVVLPIALCVLLSWLDSLMNAFPTFLYVAMIGAAWGMHAVRDDFSSQVPNKKLAQSGRLRRSPWPAA